MLRDQGKRRRRFALTAHSVGSTPSGQLWLLRIGNDFSRNVVHNYGSLVILNGGVQLKLLPNHQ
jgi:hypothetical protein